VRKFGSAKKRRSLDIPLGGGWAPLLLAPVAGAVWPRGGDRCPEPEGCPHSGAEMQSRNAQTGGCTRTGAAERSLMSWSTARSFREFPAHPRAGLYRKSGCCRHNELASRIRRRRALCRLSPARQSHMSLQGGEFLSNSRRWFPRAAYSPSA